MGRCRNCHTHFWGNPHFCPSCKTDLWYEEYNDENWDFRALQEEGNRLIAKGNYEKAAVVLKLALDQVMYKHAQHSMHRLKDAVSDFVWPSAGAGKAGRPAHLLPNRHRRHPPLRAAFHP